MVPRTSVGYCLNMACPTGSKLLMGCPSRYVCPQCLQEGRVKYPISTFLNKDPVVNEVRIRFNYVAVGDFYAETAIVRKEGTSNGNVFIWENPLIKTEKRALERAEQILGYLQYIDRLPDAAEATMPRTTLLDYSMPKDKWQKEMDRLHRRLTTKPAPRKRFWLF